MERSPSFTYPNFIENKLDGFPSISPQSLKYENTDDENKKENDSEDDNNFKQILKNIKKELGDLEKISIVIDDNDTNLNETNDNTPEESNNSVLSEPLSNIENFNLWTDNVENEIENFASICDNEAKICKKKARKQFLTGRILQISLIILGSISVYSSASNIDLDIKNSISLITGFSTTVISSIYTMFGFTKKSNITFETSLGLDNIARMIRCEMLKPKKVRKSPFDLIYYCNTVRDKLIKKKGFEF